MFHQLPNNDVYLHRVETHTNKVGSTPTMDVRVHLGTPTPTVPAPGIPIEPTSTGPTACTSQSSADACAAVKSASCTWCSSTAFKPQCYGAEFAAGLLEPVFTCLGDNAREAKALPASISVTLQWDEHATGAPVTVKRGDDGSYLLQDLEVPAPAALWSPASPNLHTLTVSLVATTAADNGDAAPVNCNKVPTQSACDKLLNCTWCKSGAIPSECYFLAQAKRLPPGVFDCDKKPHLATEAASATAIDAVQVRFGLRLLGVDDNGRLTINGEAIKLHGVNRHTMWPDTGSALSLAQVNQDVELLRDLGANYVRGAHYPQDQRYLDQTDEVKAGCIACVLPS